MPNIMLNKNRYLNYVPKIKSVIVLTFHLTKTWYLNI